MIGDNQFEGTIIKNVSKVITLPKESGIEANEKAAIFKHDNSTFSICNLKYYEPMFNCEENGYIYKTNKDYILCRGIIRYVFRNSNDVDIKGENRIILPDIVYKSLKNNDQIALRSNGKSILLTTLENQDIEKQDLTVALKETSSFIKSRRIKKQ